MPEPPTLARIRRALLALFVTGVLGTAAELALTEHYEDPWQYAPFILLGVALLVLAWHAIRPGRSSIRSFQAVMALFVVATLAGLWLHYRGNVEFEVESRPDMAGWPLFWKAIHGTAPPTLAPGAMAVLGVVGWLWSYRHPRLEAAITPGESA